MRKARSGVVLIHPLKKDSKFSTPFKQLIIPLKLAIVVAAIGLLANCSSPTDNFPKGIQHVIVIGIDGMSSEGLRKANTPVMDSLMAHGSVTWNTRAVLPSVSSPNWASMLHGAGPEQHGITSNDWEPDGQGLPPVVQGDQGRFPSIFDIVRQHRPDAEIGAVYHWSGFGRLYTHDVVDYQATYSTPDSTAVIVGRYIEDGKPVFAFIQLDHVDGAGHQHGHMTAEYLKSIAKADSLVGVIVAGIKNAGIADHTLIMITADHGGIGYGHGGETSEEMTVPVILAGSGIKPGYAVRQQVYMYDIAATAAFALRITPPYAWIGRPIAPAFKGFDEPENLWLGKQLLDAPTIFPERHLYEQAGGLYIGEHAPVEIAAPDSGYAVRYTLDGSEPTHESTLYTEPFSLDHTTVVKAKTFGNDGAESRSSVAFFRVLPSADGHGLNVSFYDPGKRLAQLPNFGQLNPKKRWNSYEFKIDRTQVLDVIQGPSFGLVYEGHLQVDVSGEYQFYTQSDDGSKLYISGQLVVDNDGDHGVIEKTGNIHLGVGKHPIRLEYFNGGGGFWLEAFFAGPSLAKQIIPADRLSIKP